MIERDASSKRSGPPRPLSLSPKLSGAPAPNRATRATIEFPKSDRPDGREPAMPLPRKAAPAPTDADDRFDDSRHPHRPVASNGSRSSGARVSSKRHGRRLGRSLLAQSKRGHSRGAGSRTASLPTQAAELREQQLAHACRPQGKRPALSVRAPSGCTDRTHRDVQAREGPRYRAGLPQT
jgi:hypothetical protein